MREEKERLQKIIAAGYNPANHPASATVEWLLASKDKAHEDHKKSLEKYNPIMRARETVSR
ncbi:MAG: hypothetical protein ACEQR8_07570 [Cypionkella sp.]